MNLQADLAATARDAEAVWRFLRLFAANHATPIEAGDGYAEEELQAAEARLGRRLPAGLRTAYAMFGRRDDLTRTQDRLLTPDELHVDDQGKVLVFRAEGQYVALWGIALSAMDGTDPPVLYRLESPPTAERVWQPFLERFSLACTEMVLSEWLLGGTDDNRELDAETMARVGQEFRPLPMPDYPFWPAPGAGPTKWYEGHGAILRVDPPDEWLWLRAASPEAVTTIRHMLPGDWLMEPT